MMSIEVKGISGSELSLLKKRHEELYEKISRSSSSKNLNTQITQGGKNDWVKEIDDLVKAIKHIAPQISDIAEDRWVRQAALQLDLMFSLVSEETREIRREIESLLPINTLAPPKSRNISEEYLKKFSYSLSEARKSRFIEEHRYILHELLPSTPEEMRTDWYSACTYLSYKILTGKIDFTAQVQPTLFDALEDVWLEDVKSLKAYHIWQEKENGRISEEPARESNYYGACNHITTSLTDPYIKAPLSRFEDFETHLKKTKKCLNVLGKLNRNESGKLVGNSHELVAKKAYHLWKKTGRLDGLANWQSAEQYVLNFYENILLAVKEGELDSLEKVKRAIQSSINSEHKYIVNCFEIALVIYFIKVENLQDTKI